MSVLIPVHIYSYPGSESAPYHNIPCYCIGDCPTTCGLECPERIHPSDLCRDRTINIYVSLRLHVQNQRKKWNFPLNFWTMRKLSDLYSGIFQTQSSGCASDVDLFRNFTKLKILNIWIVKYLLNCKRYLS